MTSDERGRVGSAGGPGTDRATEAGRASNGRIQPDRAVAADAAVAEPNRAGAEDHAVAGTIDRIAEQFAIALRRSRGVARAAAESIHPDLEPAAYSFLVRLDMVGASRPSDLAAYFRIGKATAGRQLTALENLGLVVRRPDPDDGRAHLLDLTGEGKHRMETFRIGRRRIMHERLSTWAQSDLATLADLLTRLNLEAPE